MQKKIDDLISVLDKSHAFLYVVNEESLSDFCALYIDSLSINEYNLEDIMIVEAEKKTITKEQILEIKDKFKYSNNNNSIYIIKNAEIMNAAAYNSLLKFLEEPENDVKAVLITSYINLIPDTIRSRCQIKEISFACEMKDYGYLLNLIAQKEYFLYKEESIKIFTNIDEVKSLIKYLIIETKKTEFLEMFKLIGYNINNLLMIDEIYYIINGRGDGNE